MNIATRARTHIALQLAHAGPVIQVRQRTLYRHHGTQPGGAWQTTGAQPGGA
jgi:hypothetical protein